MDLGTVAFFFVLGCSFQFFTVETANTLRENSSARDYFLLFIFYYFLCLKNVVVFLFFFKVFNVLPTCVMFVPVHPYLVYFPCIFCHIVLPLVVHPRHGEDNKEVKVATLCQGLSCQKEGALGAPCPA